MNFETEEILNSDQEAKAFFDSFYRGEPRKAIYTSEATGEVIVRIDNTIYTYLVGVTGKSYRMKYDTATGTWGYPESVFEEDENFIETNVYHGTINLHPDDINKIMILGFPHSGTTVLRAKMGDCRNAMELLTEFNRIDSIFAGNHRSLKVIGKTVTPTKHPLYKSNFNDRNIIVPYLNNKYCFDYKCVLMIKNPYQIFGSISKRFGGKIPEDKTFSFEYYEKFANLWLKYHRKNEEQVTCIKYEDMFKNDFEILKNLFNKLGLDYSNEIFTRKKSDYSIEGTAPGQASKLKNADPQQHPIFYRINQMNGEFKDMSNPQAHKNIHPEILDKINKSEIVKELGYLPPE